MSTTPEIPIRVTREMIEAHYKSVMNAARILLSQGETIHAQDLLSEACSRPYPTPAPAAADRNEDYFHNWTPHIAARAPAPMPEAAAAEPVIRAWIKETPSGVYLRDARAMAMADIPEDGPTRFGWEPLYAGGTP